ncbi:hypothetical protein GGI15_001780 [Coemansia interrupta]|uniref:Fe2OG dioxygenase domain-containing protein n=1 Tax=Coemansia interrupta TaxID=1126814 RepID=A0A9W8HK54_9FUNG|nr:hypothetical protein GGI15_001780 [Coemansia interrupta]
MSSDETNQLSINYRNSGMHVGMVMLAKVHTPASIIKEIRTKNPVSADEVRRTFFNGSGPGNEDDDDDLISTGSLRLRRNGGSDAIDLSDYSSSDDRQLNRDKRRRTEVIDLTIDSDDYDDYEDYEEGGGEEEYGYESLFYASDDQESYTEDMSFDTSFPPMTQEDIALVNAVEASSQSQNENTDTTGNTVVTPSPAQQITLTTPASRPSHTSVQSSSTSVNRRGSTAARVHTPLTPATSRTPTTPSHPAVSPPAANSVSRPLVTNGVHIPSTPATPRAPATPSNVAVNPPQHRSFSEEAGSGNSRITRPSTGEIPRPKEPSVLVSPASAAQFIRYSPEYLDAKLDKNDIFVCPDFIDDSEHSLLVKNCEKKLKRLASTYEMGHFDKRIHNYRECSVSAWLPNKRGIGGRVADAVGKPIDQDPIDLPDRKPQGGSAGWTTVGKYDGQIRHVLDRVWDLFPPSYAWLPPHILDLHQDGEILPHVDNPDYSGFVVGGLCLLGPAVSTFTHVDDPRIRVDVLLNPKSLYFMTNRIRYQFTHEITVDPKQRAWDGQTIPRARRISLMFRDAKEPDAGWKSLAGA